MIKHIVMWDIQGNTPLQKAQNIARLKEGFESQAALDAYAVHPEHLRVKRELLDIRTARYQVDYACLASMP